MKVIEDNKLNKTTYEQAHKAFVVEAKKMGLDIDKTLEAAKIGIVEGNPMYSPHSALGKTDVIGILEATISKVHDLKDY